ncbi:3-deoxy-D-manno-octulosonic acid kinase [Actinobacillus pleuropneumoniae]|uniref:3-deoxy-D-manno-octulosonic acid kinase n=1 Tax=Actinobacillus pleuropneumoniae TaxID=715 RepID=A0A9Q4DHW7_ACTPL|nr:3-deoxy-D-manno-octulosonic acid kinase [Actinobacillus pleuropneumoniae]KIE91287.1 putative 3-deoxy-D-manno-octulosonic-acid kinase [Actinobacillus pleuropneumoniae]KIE91745.1 putative 3-deoxy-D-manno-octulosonic-acid kinase [Actinobacillus pleuropneumoniae]KIE92029.1 putative 3-deoxy-D-manno-octulosonic-acid kinase [Actinobacillus pleuropneumoniae]KIE97166.1 putative 3-deoxy-D-manno-octulosonic-acid kinase [Actinobacillus pleuropneumoniae]KIE98140.1 putative 3-deoxy-D-manno-octulosonic-ac
MIFYHFNRTVVPDTQTSLIKTLFGCKNFADSGRLLGSSKGRGTTWFLNTQAELGVNTVLRHYYRGGLFGKIVKDQYLFNGLENTRAFREFSLLEKLHEWHLPVPQPIALKVEKTCFWYRADIMLEKIEGTQDLSKYLQTNALSDTQYQQIGKLIRRLHDHQVHHSDLNIHNILLEPTSGQFFLIDFDKCGISQTNDWKTENLARLLRSFKKEQTRLNIRFNEQNWQALLAGYYK